MIFYQALEAIHIIHQGSECLSSMFSMGTELFISRLVYDIVNRDWAWIMMWCSKFSAGLNINLILIQVPDNEDVKTVKTLLQGETGFPPCQQELTGFRSGGSPIYHVSDRRRLSELNLPKENVLYLNTPPPEGKKCYAVYTGV